MFTDYGLHIVDCMLWNAYYGLHIMDCILWIAYYGLHIVDCILWIAYGASLTKPTVVKEMTPIKRRTLDRGFGEPPSAIVVSRLFGT